MVIELNIARRVVSELHDAIRQPINLMDENGRIIASTDASRIGTVHSAACQAIRENMECLVVRADGEYAGSRIGVNVPLRFDGKIVGVVGVTGGNYEELSRYVHLIRTTTEALLRVQAGRAEETNAERRVQALWEDVLFRPDEPSPSALRALAQAPKVAAIGEIGRGGDQADLCRKLSPRLLAGGRAEYGRPYGQRTSPLLRAGSCGAILPRGIGRAARTARRARCASGRQYGVFRRLYPPEKRTIRSAPGLSPRPDGLPCRAASKRAVCRMLRQPDA